MPISKPCRPCIYANNSPVGPFRSRTCAWIELKYMLTLLTTIDKKERIISQIEQSMKLTQILLLFLEKIMQCIKIINSSPSVLFYSWKTMAYFFFSLHSFLHYNFSSHWLTSKKSWSRVHPLSNILKCC